MGKMVPSVFLTLNCFLKSLFLLSCTVSTDTPQRELSLGAWQYIARKGTADFFTVFLLLFLVESVAFKSSFLLLMLFISFYLSYMERNVK